MSAERDELPPPPVAVPDGEARERAQTLGRATLDEAQAEESTNLRRLMWQALVGALLVAAVIGGAGAFFKDELLAVSRAFVDTFGGPGVALGFFLPDAFPLPLPHEAFSTFALLGGIPFGEIGLYASLGSTLGGAVGFWGGRWLGATAWFDRLIERHRDEAYAIVRRHGVLGIALGAVTPLPYGICCWAAGALQMRWWPFAACYPLRWFRCVFYLWLIDVGAMSLGITG